MRRLTVLAVTVAMGVLAAQASAATPTHFSPMTGVEHQIVARTSAQNMIAACYWPRDNYWHYSPGYNVYFRWYAGSTNPVGFWFFGPMTNNQWQLFWSYC